MKAIIELERQGYKVSMDGDKIQVERKAGFSPGVGPVKILLQEIRERKAEAIRYLKHRRVSVWCHYQGLPRWVSWDACLYHIEMNDPACHGCRPERRPQSQREEAETLARGGISPGRHGHNRCGSDRRSHAYLPFFHRTNKQISQGGRKCEDLNRNHGIKNL